MSSAHSSAGIALPAPLHHPGPRHPRRRHEVATRVVPYRTVLPPNTPIVDALATVVESTGHTSAQVELAGGTVGRLSYCVPAGCAEGPTPVAYSDMVEELAPVQVLTGAATVGFRDGQRFVHCHVSWLDDSGRLRAGHLWPESSTGAVPIAATVYPLATVDMISTSDTETLMPTFAPVPNGASDPVRGTPAVVSRVLPGEDLTGAVESVCREHGFVGAAVRGGLGSLVGAVLAGGSGQRNVPGIATEVISLTGTVIAPGRAHLSAVVVDPEGTVHAGELIADRNLVAVTFELLVMNDEPTW